MSWVAILGLLAVVAAGLLVLGRLPRGLWEPVGAALLFGLAGYAWQGFPALPGAPRSAAQSAPRFDEEMVKLRNSFGGQYGATMQWLTLSDGYARQGNSEGAVHVLDSGLRARPDDAALWVAMGNALVAHGEGLISPAAEYSFGQAMRLAPQGSSAPYFYGLALASSGQFDAARKVWTPLYARLPEKAPLRAQLENNLAKLDTLLRLQAGGGA